jgi:hypothetical protein
MSGKVTMKDIVEATKAGRSIVDDSPTPGDAGYDVPFENVKLPSGGKCYEPDHPLFGCDSVDIRHMRHSDENILAVMQPKIDPDLMLTGDKNAVLIAIRNISYGSEYEVDIKCPACGKKSSKAFDMSRLSMTGLSRDPDGGPGHNRFSCVLPISKRKVVFKLLTAAEANDLDAAIEASAKNRPGQPEEIQTLRTLFQTVSIEGEEDRMKLAKLVNNMIAGDALALRRAIQKVSPGVDTVQAFTCPVPDCGETTEVEVPIGPEFFWPSAG